jgi:hypothetical protein
MRKMVGSVCALVFVLSLPTVASAQTQTAAITSYLLKFYLSGAQSPVQQEAFGVASALCGQAPPAAGSTVNPTKAVWTDISNAALACIFTEAAGGPLRSLPVGNYEGTLTAIRIAPRRRIARARRVLARPFRAPRNRCRPSRRPGSGLSDKCKPDKPDKPGKGVIFGR